MSLNELWKQVDEINMPLSQEGELTSQQCYSVVGDTFYFGGATNGKIYVSHNRGKNWSFIGTPLDIVRKVIFIGFKNRLYFFQTGRRPGVKGAPISSSRFSMTFTSKAINFFKAASRGANSSATI